MDIRRQLNEARLERSLTLEQIAMRTALSASVLRHLDEGRFELLPPGLYARSYVRAFAAEVGLDPEATLARLEHLLPGAPNPIPVLSAKEGVMPKSVPGSVPHAAETVSALLSAWTLPPSAELRTNVGTSYDFLEDVPHPATPPLASGAAPLAYAGAVAIDVLFLVALDTLLLRMIALTSAIPVSLMLREAGGAVAILCVIPVAVYFLLFRGITGSTVGRSVFRLDPLRSPHPLTLTDIVRRTLIGP